MTGEQIQMVPQYPIPAKLCARKLHRNWPRSYTRSNDQWILSTAKDQSDHIHISAINCDLQLTDIYAQIEKFENDL